MALTNIKLVGAYDNMGGAKYVQITADDGVSVTQV